MKDLYAAVGVPRDAEASDIESKIKQQFRVWNKRMNSPDLNKRQEAENRIALLAEARKVLLDPAKRADYDRRLATQAASGASFETQQAEGGQDWLQRAKDALAINDYNSAAYAAREARNHHGESPEVWEVLSRANAGLGRLSDALYEAQQAAHYDAGNPERYLDIAGIQEELEDTDAAMATYQHLKSFPSMAEQADLGIASILLSTERYGEAASILEHLHSHGSDQTVRTIAGDELSATLIYLAETVPRIQTSDGFMVTDPAEISQMRQLAARAYAVTADPGRQQLATDMENHLQGLEVKRFWPSFPLGAIIKAALLYGLIGLICAGIGSSWALAGVIGVLILLGGAARIAWLINDSHMHQWQINAVIQRMEDHENTMRQQILNNPDFFTNRSVY